MKIRLTLLVVAALAIPGSALHAISAESSSDGPIRLLACVVSPTGVLEAEVDSQTDDRMNCNIRCGYELGEKMFSHHFNVTIPPRFNGRVGRFDTNNGKPGNYSGDVGTCQKTSR